MSHEWLRRNRLDEIAEKVRRFLDTDNLGTTEALLEWRRIVTPELGDGVEFHSAEASFLVMGAKISLYELKLFTLAYEETVFNVLARQENWYTLRNYDPVKVSDIFRGAFDIPKEFRADPLWLLWDRLRFGSTLMYRSSAVLRGNDDIAKAASKLKTSEQVIEDAFFVMWAHYFKYMYLCFRAGLFKSPYMQIFASPSYEQLMTYARRV